MDLMTINEVQPIYVTFGVPEAELGRIKKFMAVGKLQVIAAPQDDPSHTDTGTLTFIDNSVDPNTGTIKLKGTFPNTGHRLWPGQFVRVTLRLASRRTPSSFPTRRCRAARTGATFLSSRPTVRPGGIPPRKPAPLRRDLVIDTGLEAGETVVTEGQLRLAPGMKIVLRRRPRRQGRRTEPLPGTKVTPVPDEHLRRLHP